MLNSIIVIDGSQLARNSLEIILAGFGYKNVRGYQRASDVLPEIIDGTLTADLILMDIDLPGGIGFCASVKSLPQWQHVPVLAMQDPDCRTSLTEAMLVGVNDYIRKPFERPELRIRIKNQLQLRSEITHGRAPVIQVAAAASHRQQGQTALR